MADMGGVGGPAVNRTLAAMQKAGAETAQELKSEQAEAKADAQAAMRTRTDSLADKVRKKRKTLKAQKGRIQKMVETGEKAERLLPAQRIKDTAQQFQQRNPELKAKTLQLLREHIKPDDTAEDILQKIQDFYPDVSLADEALEFLLETTEGELHQQVQAAKEQFNEEHGREIIAGRNIHQQAREAAGQGLGTPTSMRDMYRDVTGNPRDSNQLFQELSQKYAFKDLKKVTDFLLHSLGSDLKSKGSSIPRGELHNLMTECRSLQSILGVYRFFEGRMKLMNTLFSKDGLQFPRQLTFEQMAKQFMTLAGERYPSSDKVLRSGTRLGIDKWIRAKIIAFSQFRDAVREVSIGQIYKSVQHRDELYMALIEALEDLEDELEELEEREEERRREEEEEEEWEEDEDEEE